MQHVRGNGFTRAYLVGRGVYGEWICSVPLEGQREPFRRKHAVVESRRRAYANHLARGIPSTMFGITQSG